MKQIYAFLAALMITCTLWAQDSNTATRINSEVKTMPIEGLRSALNSQKMVPQKMSVKESPSGKIQSASTFSIKEAIAATSTDTALFAPPAGHFMPGVTLEYGYTSYYYLLGPAYTDVTWRNLSSDGISTFNWTLPDPDGSTLDDYGEVTNTLTSTDENPTYNYPFMSYFSQPSLTGTNAGSETFSYAYGGEDSVIICNGAYYSYWLGSGMPACNYEVNKGFSYYNASGDDGVYAIMNYFEKPTQKYLVDSVWYSIYVSSASTSTPFELLIYTVGEDGYFGDTIATSTITFADVDGPYATGSNGTGYYYNFIFSEFDVYNEELGFNVTTDYLEIEDAVFMEIKGFDADNVDFMPFLQNNPFEVGTNKAYILVDEEDPSVGWFGFNTSFLVNLDLSYTYMLTDDNEFNAGQSASSKTFTIRSGYPVNEIELDGTLPDWIKMAKSYNSTEDELYLTLTVGDLPEGTTERSEELTFYVNESYTEIVVNQSESNETGIKNNDEENISVVKNREMLDISYPANYSDLAIYDLSGRIYENYTLPTSGSLSINPQLCLNKSVYILVFSGNGKTCAVKMLY